MSTEIFELTVEELSSIAAGGQVGISTEVPSAQQMSIDYPMIENNPPG